MNNLYTFIITHSVLTLQAKGTFTLATMTFRSLLLNIVIFNIAVHVYGEVRMYV
jgi:hypothetical protein